MSNKKKVNVKKILALVFGIILVLVLAFAMLVGYSARFGPFKGLNNIKANKYEGNAVQYSLENVEVLPESNLTGKKIAFLGSSITDGTGSKGVSFADYIAKRNNTTITKDAVLGTTLTSNGYEVGNGSSYVDRLVKMDTSAEYDAFVCQLSTNDAQQLKPLGEMSGSENLEDFDTTTIYGALEYTIAYVDQTWGLSVVFYTSPKYDNEEYDAMVQALYQLQEKWNIEIIDMYSDEAFSDVSDEQWSLYMTDDIHPTQAGYLEWWTPYFEQALNTIFELRF